MENNAEISGNNYYVEESDNYAEKMPDYAEIFKVNKVVPLAFSKRIRCTLMSY